MQKSRYFFFILFLYFHVFLHVNNLKGQSPVLCLDEVQTNEPSLAIHPLQPKFQLIGGNVNVYFWSQDSGKTWENKKLYSTYGVYGDPVVKCSESGRFYFAHLSKTPDKAYPAIFDRIVFQYSDQPSRGFNNGVGIGFNEDRMQDKPWFDVYSPEKNNPQKDQIAITWTEFDRYKSPKLSDSARIRFSLSLDGGQSFSAAITISKKQGSCQDNSYTPEGACPIILDDGSIHVTWAMDEKIYYTYSTDSGHSWSPEKIIASQIGGWSFEKKGFYRSNALPFLIKDKQQNLHLVWADKRTGIHRIYVKTSKNKGVSWSKDRDISPSASKQERKIDCFLPFPQIDPITGTLYVIYYYKNNENSQFAYVGLSSLHKREIRSLTLTQQPFLTAGDAVFFGDYNALGISQQCMRAVWTSHSQGLVFLCSTTPALDLKSKKTNLKNAVFVSDCRMDTTCFVFIKPPTKGRWKCELSTHTNPKEIAYIKSIHKDVLELQLQEEWIAKGYSLVLKKGKKEILLDSVNSKNNP
jgi:hypothetical protein